VEGFLQVTLTEHKACFALTSVFHVSLVIDILSVTFWLSQIHSISWYTLVFKEE
jgi:hypothetical protein